MIEAFLLFFAFGTFWFWGLAAVVFFGVLILSENDYNLGAVIILALFVTLMQSNGSFALFSDPLALLKWSALYFAIGSAWSGTKWWLFLLNRGEEFATAKLKWLKIYNARPEEEARERESNHSRNHGTFDRSAVETEIAERFVPLEVDIATEIPASEKRAFRDYLKLKGYLSDYDSPRTTIVPNWRNCKEKITTWILWWPTSFLWTMLNDPLVRLAKWIYQRLGGVYDRITNLVFGKFGDMSELDD